MLKSSNLLRIMIHSNAPIMYWKNFWEFVSVSSSIRNEAIFSLS